MVEPEGPTVARSKLDTVIIKILADEKTIGLAALTNRLVKMELGKPASIRKRIAELDGRVLKRVQVGREVQIFELAFYRQQNAIGLRAREKHTARLKPLLDQFIGEIPVVNDGGVYLAKGGVVPTVTGANPALYKPKKKIPSEEDLLFPDLMYHLDLIDPKSTPNVSGRWRAFKNRVPRLQGAQKALFAASKDWFAQELGLRYWDGWKRDRFFDPLPRHLNDYALAVYRKDKRTKKLLTASHDVRVDDAKNRFDVGWGAFGILCQRARPSVTADVVKRRVTAAIEGFPEVGNSARFQELAERVDRELRATNAIRTILLKCLRKARAHEVFEGPCEYTRAAQ